MVEITSKISKVGNSYVFFIPKALVDCKVLEAGQKIKVKIENAIKGFLTHNHIKSPFIINKASGVEA